MSGGPVSLARAPVLFDSSQRSENFGSIKQAFEQVSKSLPTTPTSDRARSSKSPSPPKVNYGTKPRKDLNQEYTSRTPDPPRRRTPPFRADTPPAQGTVDRKLDSSDVARAFMRERSASPCFDRLSPSPAPASVDDICLDVPVESKHLSHLTKRRLSVPSNSLKRRPTPNFLRKNGKSDNKFSTTPVVLSQ